MKLLVATNNRHKVEELRPLFKDWELKTPADEGIMDFDPHENGMSFFENALIKAQTLWERCKLPVLADDSGLCVEALGGRPGINSARYGARQGVLLSASEKNRLLLEEMQGIENRRCAFVCCLVVVTGRDRYVAVQETLEGEIGLAPVGEHGFGYDPIVYLPELDRTVAQLSQEEKNRISHRGKAAAKMARILAALESSPDNAS